MKYNKDAILAYAAIYKKCKILLLKKENILIDNKYFQKLKAGEIIIIFDVVFSLLTDEQSRIIKNSYIYKKKQNWWSEYYARSTYFRIKSNAVGWFIYYISNNEIFKH